MYEAGAQGKSFDAIILGKGERDMGIVFTDKENSKDISIARVSKTTGKYVFIECEPINDYDVVEKYKITGAGQKLLTGSCPSHQDMIDKLLKKAFKAEKKGKVV